MLQFTTTLFLGLHKTESFEQALRMGDLEVAKIFLSNDGEYLHEIEHNEMKYIGKPVGEVVDLKTLVLLEANIYSLLEKLFPELSTTKTPLKLIAILK